MIDYLLNVNNVDNFLLRVKQISELNKKAKKEPLTVKKTILKLAFCKIYQNNLRTTSTRT